MKRLAVFIATTAGPVRVERITRERAPQSMVCLKRSSTVLPISIGYDSFVRPGSGVIERTFGPFEDGAFRLDVSDPIESGESWQLGVFVAHALAAAGGILAAEHDADAIVWLTGAVDCDLAVGSVGHVPEKIHASRDLFARAADRPVMIFVRDGPDTEAALSAGIPEDVDLVPVRAAPDVLSALRLSLPRAGLPQVVTGQVPPRARGATPARWLASGFAVTALGAAALAHWPLMPPAPIPAAATAPPVIARAEEAPQPVAAPITLKLPEAAPSAQTEPLPKFSVLERRAPAGHSCAEVQFGSVPAAETPVAAATELTVSAVKGLCGLTFAVDNGAARNYVAVVVDVVAGKLMYGTLEPTYFDGTEAFDGKRTWSIDVPRRLSDPFEIKLIAVAGSHPVAKDADWLRQHGGRDDAVKALTLQGLQLATVRHRVMPDLSQNSSQLARKIGP